MEDKKMLARINKSYVPVFWDDFFNDNLFNNFSGTRSGVKSPSVNIIEDEKEYVIEMAVPGLSKSDIRIDLENDILTISYESKESKEERKRSYLKREFSYASFNRSFQLPETIDGDNIRANHVDGILNISLPKKEEVVTKAQKSIEIK